MPMLPVDDQSQVERFHANLIEAMHAEWLKPKSAAEYRLLNFGSDDRNPWCGDTVATAARKIGLDPEMARRIVRSCYRMASMEFADNRYTTDGQKRLDELTRVPLGEMRPGHIVTFETTGGKPYGDHITVPYAIIHDKVYCYDGNAQGLLATGKNTSGQRSVVKSVRDISKVRRVWEVKRSHIGY